MGRVFDEPWWTLDQVALWAALRDPQLVEDAWIKHRRFWDMLPEDIQDKALDQARRQHAAAAADQAAQPPPSDVSRDPRLAGGPEPPPDEEAELPVEDRALSSYKAIGPPTSEAEEAAIFQDAAPVRVLGVQLADSPLAKKVGCERGEAHLKAVEKDLQRRFGIETEPLILGSVLKGVETKLAAGAHGRRKGGATVRTARPGSHLKPGSSSRSHPWATAK